MCDIRKGITMSNQKTSKTQEKRVNAAQSLKTKIFLLVFFAIVLAIGLCLWMIIPKSKSNLETVIENYMKDITIVEGENLDRELASKGADTVLSVEELQEDLGNITISGMPSSYAYIFSGTDGTMLYHPTADKIGLPVENAAANQLLAEIGEGKKPAPSVIEYEFKGKQKYAAYYIGADDAFVLIITADGDEVFSSLNETTRYSLVGAIVLILFCSVFTFFMTSLMFRPIAGITRVVNKIANMDFRENDDQKRMLKQKDETGVMGQAVNTLRLELIDIAKQIKGKSQELYESSEALSTGTSETVTAVEQVENAITEIAKGATSQAQETQSASENVVLMGNMIEEANTEVENLRTNARAMRDAGNSAVTILEELGQINQQTKNAMEVIYKQTNVTNESAQKIKEATEIITDIAEETNLLSLNASIEAARAGEQGRGFAVVAAQIQKLAEQSNESARQIEAIINTLIEESEKSVETMKSVKEVIDKQDANVVSTQNAFNEVKTGIDRSVEGIREIAKRTSKLDEARIKVVDVVQNLTAIAEENAASTEETSASAEEVNAIISNIAANANNLHEIAFSLEDSVKMFIIE